MAARRGGAGSPQRLRSGRAFLRQERQLRSAQAAGARIRGPRGINAARRAAGMGASS